MEREHFLASIDDSESVGKIQAADDPHPEAFMRGFNAALILARASVNREFDAEEGSEEQPSINSKFDREDISNSIVFILGIATVVIGSGMSFGAFVSGIELIIIGGAASIWTISEVAKKHSQEVKR